jgi:hypothetical protein
MVTTVLGIQELPDEVKLRLAKLTKGEIVPPALAPQKGDVILGHVDIKERRYLALVQQLQDEFKLLCAQRDAFVETLKAPSGSINALASFIVELAADPAKLSSCRENCEILLRFDEKRGRQANAISALESRIASGLREECNKSERGQFVAIDHNWNIIAIPPDGWMKRGVKCLYLI